MRISGSSFSRALRHHGLLVLALLCIGVGGWYVAAPKISAAWTRMQGARHNTQLLAEQPVAAATEQSYDFGSPISLALPRLALSLDILPGEYHEDSRAWTLDRTHAFYMSGAQTPATPIIYGHNIAAVFAKLDGVAPDELLQVTLADGRVLLFRYVDDLVVLPTDSSVLGTGRSRSIFLMTCTGPTFDDRRLLEFQFVGYGETVTFKERVLDEPIA